MYTVTRQIQWATGEHVVEISAGGIDYTNPDALCAKYAGEFAEYQSAALAVETAIEIAELWQADTLNAGRLEVISLGMGATGGMTMPFDALPLTPAVKRYLRARARKIDENAPKCAGCGALLPDDERKRYLLLNDDDGAEYCSESCAQNAYEKRELDNLAQFCEMCNLDYNAALDWASDNDLSFHDFATGFYAGAICEEI